jgi:starch phosphorylase
MVGYELGLSSLLKNGADVWLNNPKMYREASGTSGMTAAMNGAINLSIPDGCIPEFAKDGENCFLIQPADDLLSDEQKDEIENSNLLEELEHKVLPAYYDDSAKWFEMVKKGVKDVIPEFESSRMAKAYYRELYS